MNLKLSIVVVLILLNYDLRSQEYTPAFGCVFDTQKKTKKWKFRKGRNESFPLSFSQRGRFTRIANQETYPNCVGWSSSFYAASYLFSDDSPFIQEYFSPFFVYNAIKPPSDQGCKQGTMIRSALELGKNIGFLPEQKFKEVCVSSEDSYLKGMAKIKNSSSSQSYVKRRIEASKYRISEYYDMGINDFTYKVKRALNQGKSILIAVDLYPSMDDAYPWNGKTDEYWGSHAMNLIGYNDTLFGGCYEILNSWGSGFGMNGCLFVKYDDMPKILSNSYVLDHADQEPFKSDVRLKDYALNIDVSVQGQKGKLKTYTNYKVPYGQDEFYVPILHNGDELRCFYKTKKRNQKPNVKVVFDVSGSISKNMYVFRETVNDGIQKIFPSQSPSEGRKGKKQVYLNISEPEPGYPEYNYSKLLVIVSAEPLDENKLNEQLQKRHSDLRSFAYEAFGRKINYTDGQWVLPSETEARFEINELSNVILPMIIDFKAKGKIKD
ncbi:C1 family peptidase [Crocinitomicaceae bacterium]|nr:C1 family peptidase [Crocinitomicaceae bacterium]